MIANDAFGFAEEVGNKNVAFIIGTFGGGLATDAIANGVDMLGGSFKVFIDGDAGVFVLDFGVF